MRAREAAVQVGRDHALARSERAVVRNRGGTKKEILLYASCALVLQNKRPGRTVLACTGEDFSVRGEAGTLPACNVFVSHVGFVDFRVP